MQAHPDFFTLLGQWQTYLEVTGVAQSTQRGYLKGFLSFMALLSPPRHPWELTEDDLLEVIAALPAKGHSRGYHLRALRSFYAFSESRGGPNACSRLKVPKKRAEPVRGVLSRQEVASIVAAAAQVDPRAPHAIMLAYSTGARISSLVELRYEDCDPTRRVAYFRCAKGDKPYEVPLSDQAWRAVEALHELRDFVPPRGKRTRDTLLGVGAESYRVWLRKSAEAAGIGRRVWAHLMRHTFATELAQVTDPRVWQEMMNHQDLGQYKRYAHTDDARMHDAARLLEV